MTTPRIFAAVAFLGIVCAGAGLTQDKQYEMVPIKYDRLQQEVLKHRGKVVLVDFWAGY